MAASDISVIGQRPSPVAPITPRSTSGSLPVPKGWRTGQLVFMALIVLLGVFFNTIGYRSIPLTPLDTRTASDQIGFLVLLGLVWLATPTTGTIAWSTFQESLRRRWMIALLGISILVLAASSYASSTLQPGSEVNFMRDLGIGYIIAITLLMAVFLGVSLVPPEIERRTVLTILAKPVNRMEFLLGKFFGLCLTLGFVLVVLGGVFLAAFTIVSIRAQGNLDAAMQSYMGQTGLKFDVMNVGNALLLQFGQLAVLGALALTLSLIVSPITSITFCFIAYAGGQMSSYWSDLAGGAHAATDKSAGLSGPMQGMISVFYYVLPRLDRFDVRDKLVTDNPVQFNYVWKAFGSGLLYVAVLLLIGYLVFSEREF